MYKVETMSLEVTTAAVTGGEAEAMAAIGDDATGSGNLLKQQSVE